MPLHPHADGFPCGWECPAGGRTAPDPGPHQRAEPDGTLLRDVRDYLAAHYDPEYAHMSPALGPLLERLNRALGTPASL